MEELDRDGELVEKNNLLYRKIRPKEGTPRTNLWTDIVESKGKERTGYPTQKPRALLERIIEASSNKNDIVLDPFCGCATTCVAAEKAGRLWIGIDVSQKAYDLVKARLDKEVARPDFLEPWRLDIHLKASPPKRTDLDKDYREMKSVYIVSHPKFQGEYKVGIAKDVNARLNAYQTGDPQRSFSLEFAFETPLFRETEEHIHKHFPNRFEWVTAPLEEIKREIEAYAT